MVVDDERDIREVLCELLGAEGYQVTSSSNGAEAVSLLSERAALPALILVDLMMPLMDGAQFLATLPGLGDRVVRIPVIVMSASVQAHRQLPVGTELVRKPLDLDRLLKRVAAICRREPAAT